MSGIKSFIDSFDKMFDCAFRSHCNDFIRVVDCLLPFVSGYGVRLYRFSRQLVPLKSASLRPRFDVKGTAIWVSDPLFTTALLH